MVVALLLTALIIISLLEMDFIDLLKPILIPFIASGGAALTVFGTIESVKELSLGSLPFFIIVGLAVYSALSWTLHRAFKSDNIGIQRFIN